MGGAKRIKFDCKTLSVVRGRPTNVDVAAMLLLNLQHFFGPRLVALVCSQCELRAVHWQDELRNRNL